MWDVFRERMLGPDVCHSNVGGFTGLAQGIVARIEVFPFLHVIHVSFGTEIKRPHGDKPLACSGASPSCLASFHRGGGDVARRGSISKQISEVRTNQIDGGVIWGG